MNFFKKLSVQKPCQGTNISTFMSCFRDYSFKILLTKVLTSIVQLRKNHCIVQLRKKPLQLHSYEGASVLMLRN